jgi:hypothetical protein
MTEKIHNERNAGRKSDSKLGNKKQFIVYLLPEIVNSQVYQAIENKSQFINQLICDKLKINIEN